MPAHILVIEDNAANLELMTYLLQAFGYTVSTAKDGDDGLQAMGSENFDLVLCDVHLPTVSGYEVARQAKKDPTTKDLPLIAVTALAMVGDRDKVLAAGFDGYIAKPIAPELFVHQVEKLLSANQRSEAGAKPYPSSFLPSASRRPYRATILAVDDVAININLLQSILEPFGYQIVAAASVKEAILAYRRHDPDLIVSDIHLKDGSGFDLLNWVRLEDGGRRKRFLLISATAGVADKRRALESGAVKLLERPIEPETLLAEVISALL